MIAQQTKNDDPFQQLVIAMFRLVLIMLLRLIVCDRANLAPEQLDAYERVTGQADDFLRIGKGERAQ